MHTASSLAPPLRHTVPGIHRAAIGLPQGILTGPCQERLASSSSCCLAGDGCPHWQNDAEPFWIRDVFMGCHMFPWFTLVRHFVRGKRATLAEFGLGSHGGFVVRESLEGNLGWEAMKAAMSYNQRRQHASIPHKHPIPPTVKPIIAPYQIAKCMVPPSNNSLDMICFKYIVLYSINMI